MTQRNNVLRAELLRTLVDYDPQTGALTWKPRSNQSWNTRFAGRPALHHIHASGYRSGTLLMNTIAAHRVIYALVYDEIPEEIDHINGIRHDNRLVNLRGVTKAENARNRVTVSNTSGVCGVYYSKATKKWGAFINIERRRVHLGLFKEKDDAIMARRSAEKAGGYATGHGRIANPRHRQAQESFEK